MSKMSRDSRVSEFNRIPAAFPPIDEAVVGNLYALRNKTIEGDILSLKVTGRGHTYGIAGYKIDEYTHVKIRFSIPVQPNNPETLGKFRYSSVQGTLRFNNDQLNRFLAENGTDLFKKNNYQNAKDVPFYFQPKAIKLLRCNEELRGDQAYIFEHIKSLSGKEITAELLKVNFGKSIGVAWYDFSRCGKKYSTTVACKLKGLPGYQNEFSEQLSIFSSPPAYLAKGRIEIDVAMLYRVVLNHCPPLFPIY